MKSTVQPMQPMQPICPVPDAAGTAALAAADLPAALAAASLATALLPAASLSAAAVTSTGFPFARPAALLSALPSPLSGRWPARLPASLLALLLACAAVIAMHHATLLAMLALWWRSPTFAHGFLIVPVSAWLAWRRRAALRQLAAQAPQPSWTGLLLLGTLGLAWLLADLAHVQAMQQFAFVAMLPACVLAVLGWQAVLLLAFPLAYLFLCVPFGEVLIAPLIELTADLTVTALQWSGVPVFREGSYFSLPTGNWSVVEACSGLRYLTASLALGALFAHLHFQHAGKRLAVLAAALAVPVLANGARAYGIVMLGHYSDMRLAVGVDHLIYGWLFFGLIALLLFLLSHRWREPRTAAMPVTPAAAPAPSPPSATSSPLPGMRRAAYGALACVLLCALWPGLALALARSGQNGALVPQNPAGSAPGARLAVATVAGWQRLPAATTDWRAPLAGRPQQWLASERQGGTRVQLQLAWYAQQAPSAELLSHQDRPHGPGVLQLAQQTRSVQLSASALAVRESLLARQGERLLVWRFYRQSGVNTTNGALVKLLQARGKLLRTREDGAVAILSITYDELSPVPRALLQAYLQAALPSIERAIEEMPHG